MMPEERRDLRQGIEELKRANDAMNAQCQQMPPNGEVAQLQDKMSELLAELERLERNMQKLERHSKDEESEGGK